MGAGMPWHSQVPDTAPSCYWGSMSGHGSHPPSSEENCWLWALTAPQGPALCSAGARGSSGSSSPRLLRQAEGWLQSVGWYSIHSAQSPAADTMTVHSSNQIWIVSLFLSQLLKAYTSKYCFSFLYEIAKQWYFLYVPKMVSHTHIQVIVYILWEGSYKVLTFLLQKLTSGLLRAVWAILRHKIMSHIWFTIGNPDVSTFFFWTFRTFLLLNWPRSYLLHHCSYLSVPNCCIFHISKIYQREQCFLCY